MPGQWFSTTNQDLVRYDSLLERDWLIIKDFDSDVTRILEQPFEMDLSRLGPKMAHTPDFLLWTKSRGMVVCDVKPSDLSLDPRFVEHVKETTKVCEALGWKYDLLTEPDSQVLANLRWLAGYRDQPRDFDNDRASILEALDGGEPLTIQELLLRCTRPVLGRTVLMNLIWDHTLRIDLSLPIQPASLIRRVK